MSEPEDPRDDGLEAGLRWISEQIGRSVERLGELEIDEVARLVEADAERAKAFLEAAGQRFASQAETLASVAAMWLESRGVATPAQRAGRGPHPLDVPTSTQGLALSALDSGRWTIRPGSHEIVIAGEGPAPDDPVGLVGELRARDWVDAEGEVTLVGRNALERWISQTDPA
ncbi:MAG TPA: hypothetical protein VG405_13720 [Solirubrobacteraceae bacterium]|jgi:hypothetical protein|nr:hypothetical protein [Solirubrobacteraceae bacterium]